MPALKQTVGTTLQQRRSQRVGLYDPTPVLKENQRHLTTRNARALRGRSVKRANHCVVDRVQLPFVQDFTAWHRATDNEPIIQAVQHRIKLFDVHKTACRQRLMEQRVEALQLRRNQTVP